MGLSPLQTSAAEEILVKIIKYQVLREDSVESKISDIVMLGGGGGGDVEGQGLWRECG